MPAKFLVVEDHALLRLTLRRWLEVKFPGCQVTEACNSDEALTFSQISPPQIAIIDIGLPGAAGLTTLKQLRQSLPQTPIVALASFDSDTTRSHALTDGASVYIEKRSVLTELQPTLTKFLLAQNVDGDFSVR
ncbi:MAG TPA: response regulator transcription factor [Anaerolineae bacterium]|nr:response regulator transcription factor [Anaerolineae bacterium]HMR66055.1 response regulator transcription factor [Anaerolineae bacterium]